MVEVVAAVDFICMMGAEPGKMLEGLNSGFRGEG